MMTNDLLSMDSQAVTGSLDTNVYVYSVQKPAKKIAIKVSLDLIIYLPTAHQIHLNRMRIMAASQEFAGSILTGWLHRALTLASESTK